MFQIDWQELSRKLDKMECDCKSSWDHLRDILKHDGATTDLNSKSVLLSCVCQILGFFLFFFTNTYKYIIQCTLFFVTQFHVCKRSLNETFTNEPIALCTIVDARVDRHLYRHTCFVYKTTCFS